MHTTLLAWLLGLSVCGCSSVIDSSVADGGSRADSGVDSASGGPVTGPQSDAGRAGEKGQPEAGADSSPAPLKHVFVTSASYDLPALGGLAGADAICAAAGQGAKLGPNWVAWLSDENHDAIDRIKDVGPWYIVSTDPAVAFNNKANVQVTPVQGIDHDEQGAILFDSETVWTGTGTGGRKKSTCASWTRNIEYATVGRTASRTEWTEATSAADCFGKYRLICFEQ